MSSLLHFAARAKTKSLDARLRGDDERKGYERKGDQRKGDQRNSDERNGRLRRVS